MLLYAEGLNSSFLHVCGGDPYEQGKREPDIKFSPRMWR